jgi:hypothetical protein
VEVGYKGRKQIIKAQDRVPVLVRVDAEIVSSILLEAWMFMCVCTLILCLCCPV